MALAIQNKGKKSIPPTGKGRRTVESYMESGKKFLSPIEILRILEKYSPKYSEWNPPNRIHELAIRDKALLSILVLSCARINEPLRIRRMQIDVDSDSEFVLIRNFRVSKRKKGRKEFIAEMPLTKKRDSVLYPFTEMFMDHVDNVGSRSEIFKIKTRRARDIVIGMDPLLFPHYMRACSLTYFCNTLNNPMAVARIFGVKNIATLMRYYSTTWKAYRDELSG